MRQDELVAIVAIVLGAVGTYLLLPHGRGLLRPRRAYAVGGALAALGFLLLTWFWSAPSDFLSSAFLYLFGLAAIGGGVMMVTSRDPIYSALWFASVVLSTSGMFLLAGAQFLAAGTVIVYAGAIIVTFLFVIMLAQAEGQAAYDRSARAPARATLSCFLLLWCLVYALLQVRSPREELRATRPESRLVPATVRARDAATATVVNRAVRRETAVLRSTPGSHVAGLGATLYTDHLIAVEAAGAILFIALVGAAVIATPKPPIRPGQQT